MVAFPGKVCPHAGEAGHLDEPHDAVAEITGTSVRAEAMVDLAQAMLRAKDGPLRPDWVQLSPDPSTAVKGDIFLHLWPFWRDQPCFADIY